jgi:chitinase
LPNCSSLASHITSCQAKGKIVTLSLGGASGSVGFQSDAQATTFAQTIWNLFLGGSSSTRPFGSAILDGCVVRFGNIFFTLVINSPLRVDLDIEDGGSTGYVAFVNKIRSLANGASKQYVHVKFSWCSI